MADRLDVIWTALLILHRGPVDENQPIWTSPISCVVANNDGPVNITDEMMETNAVSYVAEQIGEDPANLQLVGVDWAAMPWVDATALGEIAHGND